jgi:hypothetical protein
MEVGIQLLKERLGNFTGDELCHCTLNNQTRCECTTDLLNTDQGMKLHVYNELSFGRSDIIQVPVQTANVKVVDRNNKAVRAQVIPVSQSTKDLPAETANGLPAVNNFVLHFEATDIPPAGFSSYIISVVEPSDSSKAEFTDYSPLPVSKDLIIPSGDNKIQFTIRDGKLASVLNSITKTTNTFSIDYYYYKGYCGDGQHDGVSDSFR